jgi:hypothetical protein
VALSLFQRISALGKINYLQAIVIEIRCIIFSPESVPASAPANLSNTAEGAMPVSAARRLAAH